VSAPDVAIAGGGIVGTALAALLAEAGASVRLYEREGIAAAASGRNSGVLQHPMDEPLVAVHEASLALYRELGHGFELPGDHVGVLVLSEDGDALERDRVELAARFPELAPEWLEGEALRQAEPAAGEGLFGYRLATGRPVPPAAATTAFAARAREAGAELRIGEPIDSLSGVTAGAVVVAAGPWTSELLGGPPAIAPLWGVNVEVRLSDPPRSVMEQAGIERLVGEGGGPDSIFSIVTAGGVSAVGSTFVPAEPDPAAQAPLLLERGARYLPALAGVREFSARACPRPQSLDGRPLLGRLREDVWVASGHGPWGISLGPGSAELVANAILHGGAIAPELAADRFGAPSPGVW
jgi:glycine/D-amino acid oxidase-like deaminating enzyme